MLRGIEELDESQRLSDEDETIIDALLEELELKTQTKMEANGLNFSTWKKSLYPALACTMCQLNVLVMSPWQRGDQRRTSKQKGSAPSRVSKWIAVMRDYCQNPNEVILQRPALKCRRRLWVPHRKRGRRKTAEQQMMFRVSCWAPHRKRGKWKTQYDPLDTRRPQQKKGAHLRSRCQWKSGNGDDSDACSQDDAAMYVKLHPPNI